MVKKRVGGAHRYKAVRQATAAAAGEPRQQQQQRKQQQQPHDEGGPKTPGHLQRKITKQVKFYEHVLAAQAALKAPQGGVQKRAQKKKKAGATALASLDSLAAELAQVASGGGGSGSGDAAAKQQQQRQQQLAAGRGTRSSIKRGKARLAVVLTETQRLQRVLAHPAYKADPIQAITNHLRTTMPAGAAPATQQQQRRQQGGGGGAGQQQQQQQQQHKKKKKKGGGGAGGVAAMQS